MSIGWVSRRSYLAYAYRGVLAPKAPPAHPEVASLRAATCAS